ncbi:hypothetical protein pb186bvf_004593 [Paramecium bursaria]
MEYLKFGSIVIPSNLIFWNKQYCYCVIPAVKLLPGHILLIPKRQVLTFQDLEPAEIFDLSLSIRFLTKHLEKYFDCSSSTVHVSNFQSGQESLNHCFIHLLPRKENDVKRNDDLYPLFQSYPNDFIRQFHNTLGLGNGFSEQMNNTLSQEASKYKEYLDKCLESENKLS